MKPAIIIFASIGLVIICPECNFKHVFMNCLPPDVTTCERCGVEMKVNFGAV